MPRERFVDPAGKPFEIETDLLASHGCALQRFRERAMPKTSFARHHAPTKSSRYGTIESRPTYESDFVHPPLHLCAHGQHQTLCTGCSEWHCVCPGSPQHSCRRAA